MDGKDYRDPSASLKMTMWMRKSGRDDFGSSFVGFVTFVVN
jgi:hypothetical protein